MFFPQTRFPSPGHCSRFRNDFTHSDIATPDSYQKSPYNARDEVLAFSRRPLCPPSSCAFISPYRSWFSAGSLLMPWSRNLISSIPQRYFISSPGGRGKTTFPGHLMYGKYIQFYRIDYGELFYIIGFEADKIDKSRKQKTGKENTNPAEPIRSLNETLGILMVWSVFIFNIWCRLSVILTLTFSLPISSRAIVCPWPTSMNWVFSPYFYY